MGYSYKEVHGSQRDRSGGGVRPSDLLAELNKSDKLGDASFMIAFKKSWIYNHGTARHIDRNDFMFD